MESASYIYALRVESLAYLSDCEAHKFPSCPQMCIIAGNDSKHECADKEALNLDPATTKYLDEIDCEKIPRNIARRCDDEISISVLEERIIFGFAFGETDSRQKYGLIEIETVEGNIDEKPA